MRYTDLMQPEWVTIATFNMPYQAHLAQARLEAEGIPVFIRDEHTISINQLYSPALGGVKVQVPDVHIKQAWEILTAEQDVELTDEEALQAEVPPELKPEPLRAGRNPKSSEVRPEAISGSKRSAYSRSGEEPPELMECPRCGGRGFIEPINNSVERIVNTLLLGLPWIAFGRPVVCRACGHSFRQP